MRRLLGAVVLGGALVLAGCAQGPAPSTSPSGGTPNASSAAPAPSSSTTMSPVATPGTPTSAAPSEPTTMIVTLYFTNTILDPGVTDCSQVYAVHRTVPASKDVLTATLRELLAGPTAAEAAKGYGSWFSPATAEALISAKVSGTTAYATAATTAGPSPAASPSATAPARGARPRRRKRQLASHGFGLRVIFKPLFFSFEKSQTLLDKTSAKLRPQAQIGQIGFFPGLIEDFSDLFRGQHLAGRDDLFVHDQTRCRHHAIGRDLGKIRHMIDGRVHAKLRQGRLG